MNNRVSLHRFYRTFTSSETGLNASLPVRLAIIEFYFVRWTCIRSQLSGLFSHPSEALKRESLARGGDRPCLGDVASGEDGGVGGEDDAWTEGLEGNAGERQAVEGSFGRVLGQTGHPLGWSSISTTAKRGDIRGTQALASDKGHAAAAAEPEESAETAEESYSYGGRGLLQQPHPRGTFQSSLGGDDGAT
ncbi:hypothetical protein EAH_00068340, partial [Eimeria acervulina]